MALNDLLTYKPVGKDKEIDITKDILIDHLDELRTTVAYWRLYPDRFVDYLCSLNPDNAFHLFFYQRIVLRAFMRHRYTFTTFTRGASKSFLAVLSRILTAILYPGTHMFMVSGVKQQSAAILQEKTEQICSMIPALANEIIWDTRGTSARTRQTKDSVVYTFKNGSVLQNIVAGEQTRGMRFQSGLTTISSV